MFGGAGAGGGGGSEISSQFIPLFYQTNYGTERVEAMMRDLETTLLKKQ